MVKYGIAKFRIGFNSTFTNYPVRRPMVPKPPPYPNLKPLKSKNVKDCSEPSIIQEIILIIIIARAWYKQMVCYDRKGTMNQVKKQKLRKKKRLSSVSTSGILKKNQLPMQKRYTQILESYLERGKQARFQKLSEQRKYHECMTSRTLFNIICLLVT